LDSANPNTPMMLGIAYSNNHQLIEAEASFKRALQLGGTALAEAHFYLADIYEKQKNYTAAARELELYLKENKEIKDPDKIREKIRNLKEKDKSQSR
jgi:tetratricopeptide (TPR) repeat protein